MRVVHLVLTAAIPANAYACFIQPEGLAEQHVSEFFLLLGSSATILALTLSIRYLTNKKRLWVPIISALVLGYIPVCMYILFMAGVAGPGGACGRPELLQAGQTLLVSFVAILVYEIFKYWRAKQANEP
ncbi:hypothetical protein [Microbulbifer sp. TYP-18]|uniref:hypothetical protein n=1 Tax=Microbulbifer sp. TYP-18 TaxID=3230024 RepID=UPI0034C6B0A4